MKIFSALLIIFFSAASALEDELIAIPLKPMKTPLQTMMDKKVPLKLISEVSRIYKQKPNPGPKANDTIQLFKYLNSEFYAEIGIGHPAQMFKVVLDTAWANSYVPSVACSPYAFPACALRNKYDSSRSGSYQPNGTAFRVQTASGDLVGFLSKDSINLGHLKVKNQTFAELTAMPLPSIFEMTDGILGMAYDSLNPLMTPFFYNVIRQNLIKKPIFSFYINRDDTTEKGGSLFLGGSNPKHYNGSFTYLPVTHRAYWQFDMEKIYVAMPLNRTQTVCEKGCQAYIDTSSIVIYGPRDEIKAINRHISALYVPKLNRYEVNCNQISKLPHVTFSLGGKNFTVHGPDYVQKVEFKFISLCLSAFVENEASNSLWGLGGAFLSRLYVEFNLERNTVGLAPSYL